MLGNVVTDAAGNVVTSAFNIYSSIPALFQADSTFANVTVPNYVVDDIYGVKPASEVIPTLTKGEHVAAPTDEQVSQYYNDPYGLLNEINSISWNQYTGSINTDVQTNAPTANTNKSGSFSILPDWGDLGTLAVIGVVAIIGLNFIRR